MNETPAVIQLVLISHAESGQVALLRAILGIKGTNHHDVPDSARLCEPHVVLSSAAGDVLQMLTSLDLNGSVRARPRLSKTSTSMGRFLREGLERYRDRASWHKQHTLRRVRKEVDAVLYLLDVSEPPVDTMYLEGELAVLKWLAKPVLVLLTRKECGRTTPEDISDWQRHFAAFPIPHDIIGLDATARCWLHERSLYKTLKDFIGAPKQAAYTRLVCDWQKNHVNRFHEAIALSAHQLVATVQDHQPVTGNDTTLLRSALKAVGLIKRDDQRQLDQAMGMLIERLNISIGRTTVRLLAIHKLNTKAAPRIHAHMERYFSLGTAIDRARASVHGSPTFAGAAWGPNASTSPEQPIMAFTDQFLRTLLIASVLRYLTLLHFGHGAGEASEFADDSVTVFWKHQVEQVVSSIDSTLPERWRILRAEPNRDQARAMATEFLTRIVMLALGRLYPASIISILDNHDEKNT